MSLKGIVDLTKTIYGYLRSNSSPQISNENRAWLEAAAVPIQTLPEVEQIELRKTICVLVANKQIEMLQKRSSQRTSQPRTRWSWFLKIISNDDVVVILHEMESELLEMREQFWRRFAIRDKCDWPQVIHGKRCPFLNQLKTIICIYMKKNE